MNTINKVTMDIVLSTKVWGDMNDENNFTEAVLPIQNHVKEVLVDYMPVDIKSSFVHGFIFTRITTCATMETKDAIMCNGSVQLHKLYTDLLTVTDMPNTIMNSCEVYVDTSHAEAPGVYITFNSSKDLVSFNRNGSTGEVYDCSKLNLQDFMQLVS